MSLDDGTWEFRNTALLASSLEDNDGNFVDTGVVFAFWDDTYIYEGTQQGIYYEVDGETVTFEYYLSHFQDDTQYYHYTVYYDSTIPGVFTMQYYQVSDAGVSATVGAQGTSTFHLWLIKPPTLLTSI